MNKPHKACDADLTKVKFPAIIMPKLDGVRACFLNGKFTSRTLKPFRNHRLDDAFGGPEHFALDGELVQGNPLDGNSCRRTTSFCSSFSENTEGVSLPTWWIFDIINSDTYVNRLRHIKGMRFGAHVEQMPYQVVRDLSALHDAHSDYIGMGYEGTIIRSPKGLHKNGRCTTTEGAFLRLKDIADEECEILNVIEGQVNNNPATISELGYKTRSSHQENKIGNYMVGSLEVQIPDGRIIIISAGRLTHDERRYYFEHKEGIIGRTCTYTFMPYGEKDMRRHPRFKSFREGDI